MKGQIDLYIPNKDFSHYDISRDLCRRVYDLTHAAKLIQKWPSHVRRSEWELFLDMKEERENVSILELKGKNMQNFSSSL